MHAVQQLVHGKGRAIGTGPLVERVLLLERAEGRCPEDQRDHEQVEAHVHRGMLQRAAPAPAIVGERLPKAEQNDRERDEYPDHERRRAPMGVGGHAHACA